MTILHVQGAQNTESCHQLALQTFLDGSPSDTPARYMGDSMTRFTLFASAVHTLHTAAFTVLMEEAGKLVRANEDATKLTDIARDMNDVFAQQKAET